MINKILSITVLSIILMLISTPVFASNGDPGTPMEAAFEGRCDQMGKKGTPYVNYPPCADTPAECGSKVTTTMDFKTTSHTPINCVFLEEPIGGEPGYDLFKVSCSEEICTHELWHGEAIAPGERVVQALLAYEKGKEYQGPFGLLYSYLGLIYNFFSGIIVAVVVLFAIIGGIMMTTSGGDPEKFRQGRKFIINALIGMALWFLASVILYTINPTFFAF
jgi:hypothetical protein